MATILSPQEREQVLARRAAVKAAQPVTEPKTADGQEFGNWADTLKSKIDVSWDAYLAANANKDTSSYSNRKLGKSLEEAKKHEAAASTFTNVTTDMAKYAPAAAVSLVNPLLGAATFGGVNTLDALGEQARSGSPLDMGKAATAGGISTALDLATGGASRLAKAPVKRFMANRAGEAVSGAGSEMAINEAAGKEWDENVLEAAAMSAGMGGLMGGAGKALKKLNPWGEQAARDIGEAENQVGGSAAEEFKSKAIAQEDGTFELGEKFKTARSSEEFNQIAKEIVEKGKTDGAESAALSAIRAFDGGELVSHALDVDIAEGLGGSGRTKNLAEIFGISKEDIKKSGDATLDARSSIFGKDIEGENTRPTDENKFVQFYDGKIKDIENVFKGNAQFASALKDKVSNEKGRSGEELHDVNELKKALTGLQVNWRKGDEAMIAPHAERALALANKLGVTNELRGFSGKAGEFDPVHDIRAARIFEQIAHKRLPGVSNLTPDARKHSTGIPSAADRVVPGGRKLRAAIDVVRPAASQKRLKAEKEKVKKLTQSLAGAPRKPVGKPSDEPTSTVREVVEEAPEAVQEVVEAVKRSDPVPPPRIKREAPVEPTGAERVGTDAYRQFQQRKAEFAEENRIRDKLASKADISKEEADEFIAGLGNIHAGAKDAGKITPEQFVMNKFNAAQRASDTSAADKLKEAEGRKAEAAKTAEQRKQEAAQAKAEREAERRKRFDESAARQAAVKAQKQAALEGEDKAAKDFLFNAREDIDFDEIGMGPDVKAFMNKSGRTLNEAHNIIAKAEKAIEKLAKGDREKLNKFLRDGSFADQVTAEAHFKSQFAKVKESRQKRDLERKELMNEVAEQKRILKEREAEAAKPVEDVPEPVEAPESVSDAVEEAVKEMTPTELKSAGKAVVDSVAKGGDVETLEIVQSEMESRGMDKEADALEAVKKVVEKIKERMKVTTDKNLWISQDEYASIQEAASGKKGNPYAGTFFKSLGAKYFGGSDNVQKINRLSTEDLEKALKKKGVEKGAFFGVM